MNEEVGCLLGLLAGAIFVALLSAAFVKLFGAAGCRANDRCPCACCCGAKINPASH